LGAADPVQRFSILFTCSAWPTAEYPNT